MLLISQAGRSFSPASAFCRRGCWVGVDAGRGGVRCNGFRTANSCSWVERAVAGMGWRSRDGFRTANSCSHLLFLTQHKHPPPTLQKQGSATHLHLVVPRPHLQGHLEAQLRQLVALECGVAVPPPRPALGAGGLQLQGIVRRARGAGDLWTGGGVRWWGEATGCVAMRGMAVGGGEGRHRGAALLSEGKSSPKSSHKGGQSGGQTAAIGGQLLNKSDSRAPASASRATSCSAPPNQSRPATARGSNSGLPPCNRTGSRRRCPAGGLPRRGRRRRLGWVWGLGLGWVFWMRGQVQS